MARQIALHVDSNYHRQSHLCRGLSSLGFSVHKAKDFQNAVELLNNSFCNLIILDFETIGQKVFELCDLIRNQNSLTIIVVLMEKPKIKIELSLFEHGVNDVVAGIQRTKAVLLKRL